MSSKDNKKRRKGVWEKIQIKKAKALEENAAKCHKITDLFGEKGNTKTSCLENDNKESTEIAEKPGNVSAENKVKDTEASTSHSDVSLKK